jgi:hypothetical protein
MKIFFISIFLRYFKWLTPINYLKIKPHSELLQKLSDIFGVEYSLTYSWILGRFILSMTKNGQPVFVIDIVKKFRLLEGNFNYFFDCTEYISDVSLKYSFEAIEENIINTIKTANVKFLIKAEHIDDVLHDDFFINIFTLPQCPSKTALMMKLNLMSKSDVY